MSFRPAEGRESGARSRYVTLCQQLLALGVVVAVLTPAAQTVTMDVRPAPPAGASSEQALGAGRMQLSPDPAPVPTGVVDGSIDEYVLTSAETDADDVPARKSHLSPAKKSALAEVTTTEKADGSTAIETGELTVDGYGTVGVTWSNTEKVAEDDIKVKVRSRTGEDWTDWTPAEYHDEHGPDPRSPEARTARPGTDALVVVDVDAVQVKVVTADAAPADLKVAVIDPGKAEETSLETPAIDTATLSSAPIEVPTTPTAAPTATPTATPTAAPGSTPGVDPNAAPEVGSTSAPATGGDLSLQAGAYTPKPQIFSRAQWGADESIRDKPSLSYYEVHAGFVHHTVNANDYTADQVPGIIRSIYNYHVKTRGWSDVGYNFLVDRFGRIWEGRAGGVDRPVVGAHTKGYNQDSFAMAAIGNYETTQPSAATVDAYAALFAWKLSLHGVAAASTQQSVEGRTFQAINGHRDAGATACPGKYLYAQIPAIRTKAAALQQAWTGRDLESNMSGSATSDLIARKSKNGKGVIVALAPTATGYGVESVRSTGQSFKDLRKVWKAGDWDRDGYVDVIGYRKDRALVLFRGMANGKLSDPTVLKKPKKWGLVAPVGDFTGDGLPDLIAQKPGKKVKLFPGAGFAGLAKGYRIYGAVAKGKLMAVGRWNVGDGATDVIVRRKKTLTLYTGNGPGGLVSATLLPDTAKGYKDVIGVGSLDADGRTDLIVRTKSDQKLYSILVTPAGTFSAPVKLTKAKKGKKFDLLG